MADVRIVNGYPVLVTPEGKLMVDAQVSAQVADSKIKGSTDAGTTWVPVKVDAGGNLSVLLYGRNPADALAEVSSGNALAHLLGFNNITWDRWRNNTEGILFAGGTRTTPILSPIMINYNARGVIIYINITAASGTGGLKPQIITKDPVSGGNIILWRASAFLTGVGRYGFQFYPGITKTGTSGDFYVQEYVSAALPRTWQLEISVGDATPYTYSVGYCLIL